MLTKQLTFLMLLTLTMLITIACGRLIRPPTPSAQGHFQPAQMRRLH
jgi:hypothetical protein